jgi:hypothetical protein
MDAVSIPMGKSPIGCERGRFYDGLSSIPHYDSRSFEPLLTTSLVTHGAGEATEKLFFPSYLVGESIWLPFEKVAYDVGVHGLEHS